MKLRAQLVLAFLLLAVVPLTGVTVFSYVTTLRAFRKAVAAEAGSLAEDLGARMETVTADLGRRIEGLAELPLETMLARGQDQDKVGKQALQARLEAELGEASRLVEKLEFAPAVSPPSPATPEAPAGSPPSHPAPATDERVVVVEIPRPPEPSRGGLLDPGQRLAEIQKMLAEAEKARTEAEWAQSEALATAHRQLEARREQFSLRFGREFGYTVRKGGAPVGRLRARVRSQEILRTVLARTRRQQGEIPFALDAEGHVYTPDPADQRRLQAEAISDAKHGASQDWVVVTRKDPASGLTLGIARPVGESLRVIRRTAVGNLLAGLAMVGLALLGILPLSRRMTRNLDRLSEGVERLGRGELDARVPIASRDEFGRLAEQFNRMAQELRAHQDRMIEQERLRKELEMCRRIQEEMLPRGPLHLPFAEAKGVSIPAREVGGDFFNYFVLPEGEVALLLGDVSGKGVPAALLMARLQATLRARLPLERDLTALAARLDEEIDASTPTTSYLTLFMGVLDGGANLLRFVNAGHTTQFLLRAHGGLVALESTGRPLGLYPGGGYEERRVSVAGGDCLFLFTDGLVEAENAAEEPFGMDRLRDLLLRERARNLDGILARVEEAVRAHRGGADAADDATMMVLRVGALGAAGGGFVDSTRRGP